ncbi:MAG: hypothetical protein JW804_03070 [Sedimentisphaerales bacterium]|nr:hypothetical protein [Sedimentisphaerales bacterium]
MSFRLNRFERGFTLIEASVSICVAMVMILGTLGFSYYSSLNAHKADTQNKAVRLAGLILDDWKSMGGIKTYNPAIRFTDQFTILESDVGPDGLPDLLGRYDVILDEANFYITLSYKEAVDDQPKALNIVVAWVEKESSWDSSDPRRFIKLTGYVANF